MTDYAEPLLNAKAALKAAEAALLRRDPVAAEQQLTLVRQSAYDASIAIALGQALENQHVR